MNTVKILGWVSVAVLALCAGCGSIRDISQGSGGQRIYGGIRFDSNLIGSLDTMPMIMGILDFPLSFVLDTAFLPVTLLFALFR